MREKEAEKISDEIAEDFPNIGKKSHPYPGSIGSLTQDKPREEYTETHINQTDKN